MSLRTASMRPSGTTTCCLGVPPMPVLLSAAIAMRSDVAVVGVRVGLSLRLGPGVTPLLACLADVLVRRHAVVRNDLHDRPPEHRHLHAGRDLDDHVAIVT